MKKKIKERSTKKIAYMKLRDNPEADQIHVHKVLEKVVVDWFRPSAKDGAWTDLFESAADVNAFLSDLAENSAYSEASLRIAGHVGLDFAPVNDQIADLLRDELKLRAAR